MKLAKKMKSSLSKSIIIIKKFKSEASVLSVQTSTVTAIILIIISRHCHSALFSDYHLHTFRVLLVSKKKEVDFVKKHPNHIHTHTAADQNMEKLILCYDQFETSCYEHFPECHNDPMKSNNSVTFYV